MRGWSDDRKMTFIQLVSDLHGTAGANRCRNRPPRATSPRFRTDVREVRKNQRGPAMLACHSLHSLSYPRSTGKSKMLSPMSPFVARGVLACMLVPRPCSCDSSRRLGFKSSCRSMFVSGRRSDEQPEHAQCADFNHRCSTKFPLPAVCRGGLDFFGPVYGVASSGSFTSPGIGTTLSGLAPPSPLFWVPSAIWQQPCPSLTGTL